MVRDNRRMASDRPYARGRSRRAEESSGRTVGEVAALARVTVRLLHHYDEIGLVSPSGRSDAGYRLYDDADLERLQQALFYRELGFALAIKDFQLQADPDLFPQMLEFAQGHCLLAQGLPGGCTFLLPRLHHCWCGPPQIALWISPDTDGFGLFCGQAGLVGVAHLAICIHAFLDVARPCG